MIDWRIEVTNHEFYNEEMWYFPDFRTQEFMLPILNVGFDYIDEYGDTSFDRESCRRLIGNLTYLEGILETRQRSEIQFDSLNDGIVSLSKATIGSCTEKLLVAARKTIELEGILRFFGD